MTIRGKKAEELLARLLKSNANTLPATKFDATGNLAFGVPEYIEIPGVEYDATIGIIGLEVAVTLMRPGFRIRNRARKRMSIPKSHTITKEEAIEYMKNKFQTRIE